MCKKDTLKQIVTEFYATHFELTQKWLVALYMGIF